MEIKKEVKISLIVIGVLALTLILILAFAPNENTETKNQSPSTNNVSGKTNAVLYEPKYLFSNFTDQNENAFTLKIPEGWQVSDDSGLIRPYVDAGVKLQATSSNNNQGFFYISPYGVYTVPNDLLTFAGFFEGNYYDPSGGLAKPMLVKSYTEAKDFLNEYVQQLDVEASILDVTERPDLINKNPASLITKQSAAEITYSFSSNQNLIIAKMICYNYLIESSGTGIWAATLFGYYSPENLFNETEYFVLKSEESFKVNQEWAAKEAREVNKRIGIISSTQDSISDTISSTFEYRTESQDRINNEWSKTTLGIEEVYNPETGQSWTIDSGSKYYWVDNKNNIYGTETDENPFPQEDVKPLEIKKDI